MRSFLFVCLFAFFSFFLMRWSSRLGVCVSSTTVAFSPLTRWVSLSTRQKDSLAEKVSLHACVCMSVRARINGNEHVQAERALRAKTRNNILPSQPNMKHTILLWWWWWWWLLREPIFSWCCRLLLFIFFGTRYESHPMTVRLLRGNL